MKPFKSGLAASHWLLRLATLLLLIMLFVADLKSFDFHSKIFYIALSFIAFAILLFVGGMLPKPTITIISGLILFGLSIYEIVLLFNGSFTHNMIVFLSPAAIGFYFFCYGNS